MLDQVVFKSSSSQITHYLVNRENKSCVLYSKNDNKGNITLLSFLQFECDNMQALIRLHVCQGNFLVANEQALSKKSLVGKITDQINSS